VKAGLLDLEAERLSGELVSAATPQPATPAALTGVIAQLIRRFPASKETVGVAFPTVVKNGKIRTAANIDPAWLGVDGAALVRKEVGRPVLFLNDADAAGFAEVRWGAGRDVKGTIIMVTLGTGIGTALFVDGKLFPNTELGHMEIRGVEAEKYASAHVRTALGLDWPAWIERVNVYLGYMQALFWPDMFILGGAVSERFDEYAPLLRSEAQIRRAHFAGQAGVIGAALAVLG